MQLKFLITIILLIASVIIGISRVRHYRNLSKTYKHNIEVTNDSIRTLKLKSGQELATIKSYWAKNEKEMAEQLEIAKKELEDIRKKLGKNKEIKFVTKVETEIIYDTIYIKDLEIENDTINNLIGSKFNYKSQWLGLKGKYEINNKKGTLRFDSINVNVPLTIGLTSNDKDIFVTSSNPYVHFSSIKSSVLIKDVQSIKSNKKHWTLGFNIGPGIYYNLSSKNSTSLDFGIGIQAGLSYNF